MACGLFTTPSFFVRLRKWNTTVASETFRISPISEEVLPFATQRMTVNSLGVSRFWRAPMI